MKTLINITAAFSLSLIALVCPAQDKGKERVETIRQFLLDLKHDNPGKGIFKTYLESGGVFDSEKTRSAANEWTQLLKESVKTSDVSSEDIYKYADRPETGRILKKADDPDSNTTELAPLEFELHGASNSVTRVQIDNLYVIKLDDQRVFVLFNDDLKMITYFALTWGHKVELVKF